MADHGDYIPSQNVCPCRPYKFLQTIIPDLEFWFMAYQYVLFKYSMLDRILVDILLVDKICVLCGGLDLSMGFNM